MKTITNTITTMKKLLFLFILMLSPMLASADDGDTFSEETVEGVLLKYTIISESEKTCMVGETYYPDVPTARVRKGPEDEVCQASGDITIPEEASGYRVVRVESFAFNQAAITSVFIPNSVKTIGNSAFTGCADLKSVRLSEQLTRIESFTFSSCESLTNIDIPEGVISIGDYAFANCKQLKEITIPSCVEHFGEDVFWNTGFTSLPKLPESLTTIPKSMFYECTQLTSIEIPENITYIDDCAFGRCPMAEIDIPASVTSIGVAAFANCKNITDLTIPNNVTEIGMNAFLGCSNLKTVTLSNNISGIREGSFKECTSLESVVIPNGLQFIGKWAFLDCSSLSSIDIPETVEEIGEQAFANCTGLIGFNCYAKNVPKAESNIFYNTNIKDITLHVPASSVSAYKAVEPWKNFKEIVALPAQDDYRPLVEEGKVWTYHYHGFNGREFNVGRVIDGDTIIGGLAYKKIYDKIGGQYQYALREEGKKVYIVYPHYEAASLLYDFSKNAGDIINELAYPLIVASVDTIDIDGVKFRRMRVQDADQPVEEWNDDLIHMYNFWIEGVGSESLLESSIREVGNAYNLISCQINGRVYTQQELLGIVGKPTPQNDYRPFVEDGKVWKVGNTQTILDNSVQVVDYYYFAGDTIINGKTCKQMMCQRFVSPDFSDEYGYWTSNPFLRKVGAWYEEDKKVYVCREGTQGMYMLYDFSLEANDTLILNDYQPYYTVGPKQTGGLNGFKGVYKDIMLCGRDYYITTWLEGVGGIDGPLRNVYPETAGDPQFLMACTVGDEVIYLNDEYEDGATPAEARKKRFDFTHTIKIQPKARKRSEELSLYGEYNDLQLGINLDPLDDAYQVRITDESGKAVYEKSVNAGSIVGLSIDISAYAKGSYTVTVENGQESFTGMFDTQTTGIKEIINNKEKGMHIYNLQGQRLSSLQKGLNIVNGKKIFMTHDN